jgi:hypothetical protein
MTLWLRSVKLWLFLTSSPFFCVSLAPMPSRTSAPEKADKIKLIKKPKGEAGRSKPRGFSIREALQIPGPSYNNIRVREVTLMHCFNTYFPTQSSIRGFVGKYINFADYKADVTYDSLPPTKKALLLSDVCFDAFFHDIDASPDCLPVDAVKIPFSWHKLRRRLACGGSSSLSPPERTRSTCRKQGQGRGVW